jgi:hypothetical protein
MNKPLSMHVIFAYDKKIIEKQSNCIKIGEISKM